jgi:hypothetical protein
METGIYNVDNRPAARVYHNAAQTTATSVWLILAFNSERFDTDTIHDTVTNNSRLTCKTAGKYMINSNVEWAGNATGARSMTLRLNGATDIAFDDVTPVAAVAFRQNLSTLYDLAVNDYVEVRASQNSGGNLNVNSTGNYSPEFSMVLVA